MNRRWARSIDPYSARRPHSDTIEIGDFPVVAYFAHVERGGITEFGSFHIHRNRKTGEIKPAIGTGCVSRLTWCIGKNRPVLAIAGACLLCKLRLRQTAQLVLSVNITKGGSVIFGLEIAVIIIYQIERPRHALYGGSKKAVGGPT